MSYRPPSKPPKGAWARHLHEQRRLRDLSQTQAFELIYERVGWSPKSRTAYVAIDMGERAPRGDEVTVLGAEFGWPPDPLDEPEDVSLATVLGDLSRELAEMRAEREAVRSEAAALRASREAWERGVVAVLRAGAEGRVPADLLDALAPRPPAETRP